MQLALGLQNVLHNVTIFLCEGHFFYSCKEYRWKIERDMGDEKTLSKQFGEVFLLISEIGIAMNQQKLAKKDLRFH